MKKRTAAFVLCVAVITLVFAGCGSSGDRTYTNPGAVGQAGNEQGTKEGTSKGGKIGEINASDYVQLGEYKGLTVTIPDTTVSAADVEARVDSDLASLAHLENVTDRPVREWDIVNIDYEGKKDGVAFAGGTASGYDLTIGSNSFIAGFEDGLIGAKVGEKRTLNLTFPEGYHAEDLAGKAVTFDVTVNSISENVIPELTDATVKELSPDYSTVGGYRDAIEKELQKEKADSAKSAVYLDLIGQARENSTIVSGDSIPQWLIEQNVTLQKNNLEQMLQDRYGYKLEDYLTQIGQTEEELDEELSEYAGNLAQQQLLIEAIVQAEGISITEDEIEKAYEEYAEEFGYESGKEFKDTLKERNSEDTFVDTVKGMKVEELLLDNAVITNPEMKTWEDK